jgi:hypothetical protein
MNQLIGFLFFIFNDNFIWGFHAMTAEEPWTTIVLYAMRKLGADERSVQLKEIYTAVKELAPSKCDEKDMYVYTYKGRETKELRWKKNVRDALRKLKQKGLVVNEGKGMWRLARLGQT